MNSFLQRFLSRKQTPATQEPAVPAASQPAPQVPVAAPMPVSTMIATPVASTVAAPSMTNSVQSTPAPSAPVAEPVLGNTPEVAPVPESTSSLPAVPPQQDLAVTSDKPMGSYVDSYAPPAWSSPAPVAAPTTVAPAPAMAATPAPAPAPTMRDPDDGPVVSTPAVGSETVKNESGNSERLEDQNIFVLLGIQGEPEADKEAFLDELQQVIWEDFLNHDVELLLTEEEMKEFRALGDQPSASEEERQGKLVEFLEKLVPDLEKIMLDKALELKEEMVRERLKEMTREAASDQAKSAKLTEVTSLFDQEKWFSGAQLLNSLE